MTSPKRIQLKRVKGWRLPPNTVVVARPSKWGNPFTRSLYGDRAVAAFRDWINLPDGNAHPIDNAWVINNLHTLRGKNLACWCKPGEPCHADVLLELANGAAMDIPW